MLRPRVPGALGRGGPQGQERGGAGRAAERSKGCLLAGGSSPQLRGIMTVGARLRSKAASSLVGRGPFGRSRRAGDEETDAIVEHLEGEDEDPASPDCEREEGGRRAGTPSARRVHLAALPERYDPLEEPVPGDKPKKRYRRKLKKYGKVGFPRPGRLDPGRTPESRWVELCPRPRYARGCHWEGVAERSGPLLPVGAGGNAEAVVRFVDLELRTQLRSCSLGPSISHPLSGAPRHRRTLGDSVLDPGVNPRGAC